MPIFRSLADRLIVRAFRDRAFESAFLRKYFLKTYNISVGDYTTAGAFDRWRIPPGTRIGRYCSISASARLIDANHPVSALSTHPYFYLGEFGGSEKDHIKPRPPVVEDDVWLSHNTTVLPSCQRVGRGSVIGAGSVIIDDVPRYAVMLGSPARLVRYRFSPEVIAAIEATRWWLLDKATLKRGGEAAPGFLTAPTVKGAEAFCAALGLPFEPAPPDVDADPAPAEPRVADGALTNSSMMTLARNAAPDLTDETLETAFSDLGVDSLGMINLRMAAEMRLGRAIGDRAWSAIVTPADLLALDPPTIEASSAVLATPIRHRNGDPAELYWLPGLTEEFSAAVARAAETRRWSEFTALANQGLDLLQIDRLDRELRQAYPGRDGDRFPAALKIAVLASDTTEHLAPSIRAACARRNIFAELYFCDYGQYFQDVVDTSSRLYAFKPDVVLFSLDAHHLLARPDLGFDSAAAEACVRQTLERLVTLWTRVAEAFSCQVIQQTVIPSAPALIGGNERRMPGSPASLVARLNAAIEDAAEQTGVDLLDVNDRMVRSGISSAYDPALWDRNKQEIAPSHAAIYGELVARLIAAQRGLSKKCLVLDLDNTLWGGVIGDDGLAGLRLGQGSAEGEAHLALQAYAKQLAGRGVILAVCSKNEESNALLPFAEHPEMILKREDIAYFVANWDDKPTNLRAIAAGLNIGLESLVFVDDNPFERNLVRRELPMVGTPELPEDPSHYTRCIADAGYFEQTRLTAEDFARGAQYQAAARQTALKESASDMDSYLSSLDMELRWSRFDELNLSRVTQLINKTNQFNMTTKRYTEQQVREVMADPAALGLYFRLVDSFGDSGIIAVLIGRLDAASATLKIDSWLMSCRVFGRRLEPAMLTVLLEQAKSLGAKSIVGEYLPTAKNGLAADVFKVAGFQDLDGSSDGGALWMLPTDQEIAGDRFPGAVIEQVKSLVG